MRQLVTYIRVSTAGRGKSGLGIEAQRAALVRFAEAEGCEILAEFVKVETGKGADALDRRPQLAAALAEKERQLILDRTRVALLAKKAQGVRLGNPVNLGGGREGRGHTTRRGGRFRRQGAADRADDPGRRCDDPAGNRRRFERAGEGGRRAAARGGEWHDSTVRNLLIRAV